jgi:Spy/CpxP family protein refolding chaperone
MKVFWYALAFLAAVLASAQLVADEARVVLVERFQELDLTDEQEAKIAEIQEMNRPKIQTAAQQLATVVKEEVDKVKAILTPEQKEKLAALKDEFQQQRAECLSERLARIHELDLSDGEIAQLQTMRKELRPQVAKAMEGLRSVLTDEQRAARHEALQSGKTHAETLASLKLTDAQKQQVRDICSDFRDSVRQELQQFGAMLTSQQKEKLAEFKDEKREQVRDREAHRIANLQGLNLTAEQREKISTIRQEYRPKVQEAGNALRGAIRTEVQAIAEALKS